MKKRGFKLFGILLIATSPAYAYKDACPGYEDIAIGNFHGWTLEIKDSKNQKTQLVKGSDYYIKFQYAYWDTPESEASCVYRLDCGELVFNKKGLPQPTSKSWEKWLDSYWCSANKLQPIPKPENCTW